MLIESCRIFLLQCRNHPPQSPLGIRKGRPVCMPQGQSPCELLILGGHMDPPLPGIQFSPTGHFATKTYA